MRHLIKTLFIFLISNSQMSKEENIIITYVNEPQILFFIMI